VAADPDPRPARLRNGAWYRTGHQRCQGTTASSDQRIHRGCPCGLGSDDAEHRYSVGQVHIPPSKALDFGFIDPDEYRRAMAGAREATRRRMIDVIEMLDEHEHRLRAELTAAMGNTGLFAQMASRRGIEFRAVNLAYSRV
jgi:hypothetical protein